jgi:hypothetical protein
MAVKGGISITILAGLPAGAVRAAPATTLMARPVFPIFLLMLVLVVVVVASV